MTASASLRIRWRWLPIVVGTVIGAAGCEGPVYRAETVLHANGRIARAIFQPRSETPAEVGESGAWRRVTASIERPPKRWEKPITDLPDEPADDKHPYLVAIGTFASADKLPTHFVAKAPEGLPDGGLKCSVSRSDYLFVIELDWQETLTDSLSLPDVPAASAELADFCGDVLARLLERELGKEYDVEPVREWARKEGRDWITALALSLYELGVQRELKDEAVTQRRLLGVCSRFGLQLTDESGHPLDERRRDQAIEDFLRRWMKAHCLHRSGAADPEKFETLIYALLRKRPMSDEDAASPLESRLGREMEEIAIEVCGSKVELESRLLKLKTRITGLYSTFPFHASRRFHYTLKVPGRIVSTNGERVSAGEVEWSFQDSDAFPLGYRMACRTLVADADAQKRLLGARPLLTLDSQREFIRLISADTGLASSLQACRKTHDLSPLERYRDSLSVDSAEGKNVAALWRLLRGDSEKLEDER